MDFAILESANARLALACIIAALAILGLWRWWSQSHAGTSGHGRPRTLDAVDTLIGWPPEATRVLTYRHQRALELLRQALPDHIILAQVPLSRFLKVPTRHSYLEWLRRVGHVCVDLIVCDASSNVLGVIELRQPDKPLSERARKRHVRVDRVLRAAGIPLHVWNEMAPPDLYAVRKIFLPSQETAQDTGPDTSPLEGRPGQDPYASLPGYKEPPRTTWFDELHATRPTQLDTVEVIASDTVPAAVRPAAPRTQS